MIFEKVVIYAGIDVHNKSWDIQFLSNNTILKRVHLSDPSTEKLVKLIAKNYPDCEVKCVYEAGFSGFWLASDLNNVGIETMVVHPADVPTTDKEKRFKDDKTDCKKLALCLRSGLLSGIYIPTKQQILDRGIVRQRYEIKSNSTKIKNRISSHIYFLGSGLRDGERYWSKRYINFLEKEALQSGDLRLQTYVEQLKVCRKFELKVLKQIRALSKQKRFKNIVELLLKIPGVGLLTTMVFITEIMDRNRFTKKDSFMSYLGLIPGKISSGEKTIMSKRTNRGNKKLRTALIQSAWIAIRNYPELTVYYEKCRLKQTANKAIIKVARKLADRMRYVYRTGKELDMA